MKSPVATMYAAIVTTWTTVIFAIATEVSAPFKSFLTSVTGQHWATKSVFALIIFFAVYAMFRKSASHSDLRAAIALAVSVVLGGVVIFAYFVFEFFK